MESNIIKGSSIEDLRHVAEKVMADRKVRIERKGRGISLIWESYGDMEIEIRELFKIEVSVFRDAHREIAYPVKVFSYEDRISPEIISFQNDINEAFAIKDLMDEMIAEFKQKGEPHEPNNETA